MAKPTRDDFFAIIHGGRNSAAERAARLVDAAWTELEAALANELERGRKALEVLNKYKVKHADTCRIVATAWEGITPPHCTCGLHAALAELRAPFVDAEWGLKRDTGTVTHAVRQTKPGPPARWEYAGENDLDVEHFNDLQLARRQGYEHAMRGWLNREHPERDRSDVRAAAVYPVKVRRLRVLPDPHGDGEWTTDEQANAMSGYRFVVWNPVKEDDGPLGTMHFDSERVALMQSLLDQPYGWVDDTSPET